MASATPTSIDAVQETTSNLSTPSLPSLEEEPVIDLPEFDNSLVQVETEESPPYDQPAIQGLLPEEHRE